MKTRLVLAISTVSVVLGLAAVMFIPSLQAATIRRGARTDSSAGAKDDSRTGYAIVVPANHPELDGAVQALKTKHAALGPKVFTYKQDVREVLPDLQKMLPYYTCFVTPKELAGRAFTGEISRMAREILPDPYCDTFWGILTGYDTSDIKRVAEFKGPINITDALDMVGGFHHSLMRRCYSFDETQKDYNLRITDPAKKYDNKKIQSDKDFTEQFLKLVKGGGFQIMMTSGHASEHDWASGYLNPNMYLIDRKGGLAARDTKGRVTEFKDMTPKIWCAAGNCLIGNIPHGQDSCMATAMIHSFGVYQLMGYTIETWFGRQGWTAQGMLTDYPGYYSFNEAFHFTNAWIVENLVKNDWNRVTLNTSDYDTFQRTASASLRGLRFKDSEEQKEALGLLYDRDVVAFYGDPAMRAAIDPKPGQTLKLERTMDAKSGVLTLKLTALKDDQWKDQGVYLPYGFVMASPEIVSKSFDADVITASAFACVKLKGPFRKGDKITLALRDAKNGKTIAEAAGKTKAANVSEAAGNNKETNTSEAAGTLRKMLAALPAGATATDLASRLERALSNIPQDKLDRIAIFGMTPPEGPYLAALLAEMPECDYKDVEPFQLLEHVRYALKARKDAPWRDQISEDLFLRYILPYWSVNEKRDPWRKMFYDKFMPAVRECRTASEAVKYLNDHVFKELNVTYDAVKRPKADQSAQESIAASYASCTGLSVILLNACRACGIPARFTGCPQWTDRSGNHSWIEFWDDQWIYEGASSSDPRNRSWVGDKVKEATEDSLVGGVWAITTEPQKDGSFFVLPWNPSDRSYPAVPLRAFYLDEGIVSYDITPFSEEKAPVWLYYKGEPWYRLPPPITRTVELPESVLLDITVLFESDKEAKLVPLAQ